MDQKKTLFIALAVAIFIAVIIGAAVILWTPAAKTETASTSLDTSELFVSSSIPAVTKAEEKKPAETQAASVNTYNPLPPETPALHSAPDSSEIQVQKQPAAETPGYKPSGAFAQTENLTVIATGEVTIDLNALKSGTATLTAKNPAAEKMISDKAKTEQKPEKKAEPASVKKTEPKPAKKAETSKPSKAAKKSEPAKQAKKSEPVKPAAKASPSYWVQVASYGTKQNADEARSTLEANEIPCEVFTFKNAEEKLFYRVRVGPYTTKNEAEYWKTRIDAIEMFSKNGTYVTDASAKNTAKK